MTMASPIPADLQPIEVSEECEANEECEVCEEAPVAVAAVGVQTWTVHVTVVACGMVMKCHTVSWSYCSCWFCLHVG